MPLTIPPSLPTILIRKSRFEAQALSRHELDRAFTLTDSEFRVEEGLIAVGPLANEDLIPLVVSYLEEKGLRYFDDFFEMSGNWPEWLALYARADRV